MKDIIYTTLKIITSPIWISAAIILVIFLIIVAPDIFEDDCLTEEMFQNPNGISE